MPYHPHATEPGLKRATPNSSHNKSKAPDQLGRMGKLVGSFLKRVREIPAGSNARSMSTSSGTGRRIPALKKRIGLSNSSSCDCPSPAGLFRLCALSSRNSVWPDLLATREFRAGLPWCLPKDRDWVLMLQRNGWE